MSTVPEKMAKQFAYQRTRFASTKDPGELFVSVEFLAAYLLQQHPGIDKRRMRLLVKVELERLVRAGQVRRWEQVHGSSLRFDRTDHYYLTETPVITFVGTEAAADRIERLRRRQAPS